MYAQININILVPSTLEMDLFVISFFLNIVVNRSNGVSIFGNNNHDSAIIEAFAPLSLYAYNPLLDLVEPRSIVPSWRIRVFYICLPRPGRAFPCFIS